MERELVSKIATATGRVYFTWGDKERDYYDGKFIVNTDLVGESCIHFFTTIPANFDRMIEAAIMNHEVECELAKKDKDNPFIYFSGSVTFIHAPTIAEDEVYAHFSFAPYVRGRGTD